MNLNKSAKAQAEKSIDSILSPDSGKFSFSKKIIVFIFVLTAIVSIAAIMVAFINHDSMPFEFLIPAVFSECAVVSGFYSWKAKMENKMKLEIKQTIILHLLELDKNHSQEDCDYELDGDS